MRTRVGPAGSARSRGLDRADLRRALSRHRVLLAAGLAAAAVAVGLESVAPTPVAVTRVMAAARDLPAGTELAGADLVQVALPVALVPEGSSTASAQAVGRVLAGPVRRGEPVTDARLLGPALLSDPDQVAVPVRLADPAATALVRAGDRIDVLSASSQGGASAQVVAAGVQVLAVPQASATVEGALVVVATSRPVASRLAASAVSGRLSLALLAR